MASEEEFNAACNVIDAAVASGLIPGAAAMAGRQDDVLFRHVRGQAQVLGTPRPLHKDTLFDVASLTKVVATLPSVLLLMQRGELSLESFLSRYFDEFSQGPKSSVRVSQLLTHTAGLVSHQPFYERAQTPGELMAMVRAEPLARDSGTQVEYSDLGYMLLGSLVEKITGENLAEFACREIFKPLNMTRTGFLPAEDEDCAATEMVGHDVKCGVVHDENAACAGGIAGHAGLFAPVRDLARYLAFWTNADKGPLGRLTREQALINRTAHLGGHRGWGWVLRGDGYDVAGDLWPASTASHTGFTGTSLVFDRPSGYWAVLLTNRVHFGRQTDISDLRRRFHNAVAHALFR